MSLIWKQHALCRSFNFHPFQALAATWSRQHCLHMLILPQTTGKTKYLPAQLISPRGGGSKSNRVEDTGTRQEAPQPKQAAMSPCCSPSPHTSPFPVPHFSFSSFSVFNPACFISTIWLHFLNAETGKCGTSCQGLSLSKLWLSAVPIC